MFFGPIADVAKPIRQPVGQGVEPTWPVRVSLRGEVNGWAGGLNGGLESAHLADVVKPIRQHGGQGVEHNRLVGVFRRVRTS